MYKNETGPTWQVKSVEKAISILSCFTPTEPELSLVDISHKLNLPKSTTFNLLRTLEAQGFVRRTYPSQNYRLGYTIMQLNYCAKMSMPVVSYALPFLENLHSKTGKTIYLTSHLNGKVFYLDAVYQNRTMLSHSISGKTLNMHCTGCGKAMLAFLPENEVSKIITDHGLPASTPNTITNKEKLLLELEEIRRYGYSRDREEETLGVSCIAAPIRNSSGYPTAAISISGVSLFMQDEQALSYADILINTCQSLSAHANEFPANQNFSQ